LVFSLRQGKGAMKADSNLQKLLAQNLAEILRQGVDLLNETDDAVYTRAENGAFGGAVGGHFRHCLEFVNCFLNGIETGRVDYDSRTRDQRIETNREYAIAEFMRAVESLEKISFGTVGNFLLVKPEDAAGENDNEEFWCASSIERELEFLQSHTIHHYALIGFKLRAFGFPVAAQFGVAPSTLRFWRQRKLAAG
jgi:uncharacterized damage-inducible protein DinB